MFQENQYVGIRKFIVIPMLIFSSNKANIIPLSRENSPGKRKQSLYVYG